MDCLYVRNTGLFLTAFILLILHVSTKAQDHAPKCLVFKVQRGTVHKALTNKPFKILCNMKICDYQTINITWTKENLKEWIPVSGTGEISSSQKYSAPDLLTSCLTFSNISANHDGRYRCELKLTNFSTFSHYINISVSDDSLEDESSCTEKNITRDNICSYSQPWWMPYLCICIAVVISIFTLILIFILCTYGFKTLGRKKTQRTQVQDTETSVWLSASPSVLKRDDFVTVQYSEETQHLSRDLNTCSLTLPPVHSTSHLSDCGVNYSLSNRRDNSSRHVIYASLSQLKPTPSTAPHPTREEFSEYAAIRVS